MIDLIEEHLAEIQQLCCQYAVLRLDLVGSTATGDFNEATSDLDFVATFAYTRSLATPTAFSTSPNRWKLSLVDALTSLPIAPLTTPSSGRKLMPRDDPSIEPTAKQRLRDVIGSWEAIRLYTAGMDCVPYRCDALVRDGVERRLSITGEALNCADDDRTIDDDSRECASAG